MIALLHRADDLGFLSANQKRYLLQQFNERKIRRREPLELDIEKEKPSLLNNFIRQYKEAYNINDSTLSARLGIHRKDFLKYYCKPSFFND